VPYVRPTRRIQSELNTDQDENGAHGSPEIAYRLAQKRIQLVFVDCHREAPADSLTLCQRGGDKPTLIY
jgi:hypothetical protein